ncbi:outer membrane beta-barrel protein [uncultured Shewanella sp.]|uniref:outer membrane beta-barrel protein n=1 Tax=uncultured Shewanella sp. TaxID=173975 RepID=UPI0026201257|nr:outer membrane beta-barrel protein [uncultured Shewanella sp.]
MIENNILIKKIMTHSKHFLGVNITSLKKVIYVALLLLFSVAIHAQQADDFYIGLDAGVSKGDSGCLGIQGSCDSMNGVNQLSLGYNISPWLSAESGFIIYWPKTYNNGQGSSAVQGFNFAAKFDYELPYNLSLYSKVGGVFWSSKYDGYLLNYTKTGLAPFINTGVTYKLTNDFTFRLGVQYTSGIGGAGVNDTSLMFGFVKMFGANQAKLTPKVPILSDEDIDDTIKALRAQSLRNTQASSAVIDSYGLSKTSSELYIDEYDSLVYKKITFIVNGIETSLPLKNNYAKTAFMFPKGEYNVKIKIDAISPSGQNVSLKDSVQLTLYQSQGMSFFIQVEKTLFGEKLNVQAY